MRRLHSIAQELHPLTPGEQAVWKWLSLYGLFVSAQSLGDAVLLFVAGQTYAEIAQELVVSRNTIKTQVSSIYRKLGVNRRAEASAVARQLQLL
jgi:DNA-binding CsgD family transcriptional regulator